MGRYDTAGALVTDFREMAIELGLTRRLDDDERTVVSTWTMMMRESPFSAIPSEQWVTGDALCFAVRDANPVSPGHSLVIPVREITTWFDATLEEWESALRIVAAVKEQLDEALAPDGYNVGFNAGQAAGQTVFHAHIHVIPRFAGDVENPVGGVRHAVVGRGHYDAG